MAQLWSGVGFPSNSSIFSVADIDAPLKQQILDLAQRKRIPDIHHHRQADDLGRRVEIAERIFHPTRLRTAQLRIKPVYFDNARQTDLS